jgi:hypothetical protein
VDRHHPFGRRVNARLPAALRWSNDERFAISTDLEQRVFVDVQQLEDRTLDDQPRLLPTPESVVIMSTSFYNVTTYALREEGRRHSRAHC